MVEVLFYHLQRRPLEAVLPTLLEKSLERGWRVVVQCGSEERVEALNGHLWTFREDSFLPHGMRADGHAERQPIYLTSGAENPNQAQVRFLVDRAVPGELADYLRAVFIFDGRDPDAVSEARGKWKEMQAAGHEVTYWQQDEGGRWVRGA